MATHSSTLAWKIPWTEEPERLQSLELQRARHDLATEYAHMHPSIHAPRPHPTSKTLLLLARHTATNSLLGFLPLISGLLNSICTIYQTYHPKTQVRL